MARRLPWPPNVWVGVSVETQTYVSRIRHLLRVPAAVRFISAEPLLGTLDLTELTNGLDWVILGGESGRGARPCELSWVRDLVDQCRAAGVAPFVKQLGSVWAREHHAADAKGRMPEDWPADLQIREMPGRERELAEATL
jgi:protein gp37